MLHSYKMPWAKQLVDSFWIHKAVARRIFALVHLMHQVASFPRSRGPSDIHASVTSKLDCCNVLYMGLLLKATQDLWLVQTAVAQAVIGARSSTLLAKLR